MNTPKLSQPNLWREDNLIGGTWRGAADGAVIEVRNPADDSVIGTVPSVGSDETRMAIEAAEAALPDWRARTAGERAEAVMRWHDLMMDHQEDLARIMTLEQGKPLKEAKGEIAYAASFLKWFAEEARRVYGDVIPAPKPEQHIVVIKQPVGVTAAITPWNFPAAMITRKAGAAIAAGCTMVVKPASATPYSALALGVLAEEAGIPAGVLSIVTGASGPISRTITEHKAVRKLSFTGSVPVGRKLMEQCAAQIMNVSLELGGNAPFIVFDDADVEKAVEGAMASKFRNTGQTCVCANRIFVQSGIHDDFVERFASAISAMKVGDGFEDGVEQGPLINRAAADKVREHFEDALKKGAVAVTGKVEHPNGGNYVEPTLLRDVTTDMLMTQEETFGPLAGITRFDSEDEVIRLANDTPYGLAAYFYSRDIHRVWRVAEALEAGIIGINEGLISTPVAPFGGVKESGLGREGSKYGIEEYLEIKYLAMGGE